MKKRRTLVISLLLVAAIALGVGYAGLTGHVTVEGNVLSNPVALDVDFSDAQIISEPVAGSSDPGAPGDHTLYLDVVGLSKKDDAVVAQYTVINNNAYDVAVKAPDETVPTSDSDKLTIAGTLIAGGTGDFDAENSVYTLSPGETAMFTVTVTLTKDTGNAIETTFKLTVPVESVT